jgi:methionyl-tRNA formyltransferase
MRIIILTSHRKGTASYCLPLLIARTKVDIAMVILNEGRAKKGWKHYKKKIKKIYRIGIIGAINGIRIRNWFHIDRVNNTALGDIENICKAHNIAFYTTSSINCARTETLIRSVMPDLGLSLGNSYIGSQIFSIPSKGMINIHGEVLPQFKNAQSVIWQLYEGNRETGYTIHKIEKGIDTGNILKQEKFPIIFEDTLRKTISSTCTLILQKAAQGLVDVVNNFQHYSGNSFRQEGGKSFTTPSIWQYLKIKRQFQKLKSQFRNLK